MQVQEEDEDDEEPGEEEEERKKGNPGAVIRCKVVVTRATGLQVNDPSR